MKHILKIEIEIRTEGAGDGMKSNCRANAHFIERALSDYVDLLCDAFTNNSENSAEVYTFSPRHTTDHLEDGA